MRITALRIAGFGPFRAEQRIDFEQFAGDGVFLISGKTGSGKSSVLDAIVFALYGSVPRYEGLSGHGIRSHHAAPEDPSYVELEFELGDTRYLLRREPEYERPKRRGTGTTKHSAAAQFSKRVEGEWHGIAARPVDVAKALSEVLPLSRAQFLQVVLLAQNRFQEFLHATTGDRQAVLRALFATDRFKRLTASVVDARREAVDAAALATANVERIALEIETLAPAEALAGEPPESGPESGPDLSSEAAPKLALEPEDRAESTAPLSLADAEARLALVALAAARASVQAAETAARQQRAEAELGEARRVLELQTRRQRLTEDHARLALEADAIAESRRRLALAGAAAPLATGLERCASTTAKLGDLNAARSRASRALVAHLPDVVLDALLDAAVDAAVDAPADVVVDAPADDAADDGAGVELSVASLSELVDESTRVLGSMEDLLRLENALPGSRTKLDKLRSARTTAGAKLEKVSAELALLPERRSRLHDSITSSEVQAATAKSAEERLELTTQLIAVGVEHARLADEQVQALARSARLGDLASTQAAAERALIARRLASSAVVLAQELLEDTPCPVCGSREHPAPASGGTDDADDADDVSNLSDVSDEALERARTAAAKANDEHAEAQLELSALVRRASALEARLDGQSSEQLDLALAEAKQLVATAREAALALDKHRKDLADLERREQSLLGEQERARSRDGELAAEISALDARILADTARVDAGLEGFASISARAHHVGRTRELAVSLLGVTRDRDAARNAAEEAEAHLEAALAESPFADRFAASDATLPRAKADELDTRIRKHEQAAAAAATALADPSLHDLPEEPSDVAAAVEARASAGRAHEAQIARQTSLGEQANRLGELVRQLAEELTTSEALLARAETLRVLAGTLSGQEPNEKRMSLEAYVLAAELEEIVAAANAQLARMTAGRYSLEHDDGLQYRGAQSGLGLRIADAYTGRSRATESLSGGETFLASLALALGLAETVTARAGGVRLDTLFIDEGFGSLDAETLGAAMATLDRLRSGGRTIGVISHVEAMQEQISAKLQVAVDSHGESRVLDPHG
ncbi:hypothetical protein C5B85_16200 [Pseudoclavibacter sp. AY1F1]|uniref:AAA family ATPase n=1 Tax=Pseudoclavibacter sp. AY1F1 TaxID=2080583 RepID=UPI000CE7B0E3|nr:SMC family ATPase [Pseudoclavibacter sp. AY1F1]PPF42541.1 hypothetical protein C5B85_16200 [Pseudoclavibacter sp. AY1F1]